MLIDNSLVLFEGAVSTGKGSAIALNALQIPGKAEPIPIICTCTEALAGATKVTFVLEQAEEKSGTFTEVAGTTLAIEKDDFTVGKCIGWRFLSRSLTMPWLRLSMTVTGTATAGKLFCAVSGFEDEPYEVGQYINKGEVLG